MLTTSQRETIEVVSVPPGSSSSHLLILTAGAAGAVMFQQGRRLGELAGRVGVFNDVATLQCQSYLAAANALALVDAKHAWVAVIPDENAPERVRADLFCLISVSSLLTNVVAGEEAAEAYLPYSR